MNVPRNSRLCGTSKASNTNTFQEMTTKLTQEMVRSKTLKVNMEIEYKQKELEYKHKKLEYKQKELEYLENMRIDRRSESRQRRSELRQKRRLERLQHSWLPHLSHPRHL